MLVHIEDARSAVESCLKKAVQERDALVEKQNVSLGNVSYQQTIDSWNKTITALVECQKVVGIAAGDTMEVADSSWIYKAMMATTT